LEALSLPPSICRDIKSAAINIGAGNSEAKIQMTEGIVRIDVSKGGKFVVRADIPYLTNRLISISGQFFE
jgi:hypothetical protein